MKLSHFKFELPEELLASYPAEQRDEARLMVLDRKTQWLRKLNLFNEKRA